MKPYVGGNRRSWLVGSTHCTLFGTTQAARWYGSGLCLHLHDILNKFIHLEYTKIRLQEAIRELFLSHRSQIALKSPLIFKQLVSLVWMFVIKTKNFDLSNYIWQPFSEILNIDHIWQPLAKYWTLICHIIQNFLDSQSIFGYLFLVFEFYRYTLDQRNELFVLLTIYCMFFRTVLTYKLDLTSIAGLSWPVVVCVLFILS